MSQIYSKPFLASVIQKAAPEPKLELTQSQIDRLKTTADVVLAIAGVAGLVLVSAVAPNALQVFKSIAKKTNQRGSSKERQKKLVRSFYYLKDKNYIRLEPNKKDIEIHFTDKGKRKLKELRLNLLQIKKPLYWDRKFWQVAADIPIQHRRGADALRAKLKEIGFYSLQRTLWFYPYDPRKEIDLLVREYSIGQFVTVMKIAKLEYADHKTLSDYFRETGVVEF